MQVAVTGDTISSVRGWVLLWVGSVGLVAACSSEDATKTEVESYWARYARASCEIADACCQAASQPNDVDACVTVVTGLGSPGDGAVFDSAAGEACIAGLQAMNGHCSYQEPAACDRALSGSLPPGATCNTDMDCALPPEGRAECDFGRCVHLLPAEDGKPCGMSQQGDVRYDCDDTPGFDCDPFEGLCKARLPLGASCPDLFPQCVEGAYCDGVECVENLPLGQDCSSGGSCVEGAYCEGGICASLKAAGQTCTSFVQCRGFCDTDGKCATAPIGAVFCSQ